MILKNILHSCLVVASALALLLSPAASVSAVSYPDYRYVAMGDSVAAGLGLDGADATCGRSSQAYSSEIAKYYSITAENIACSGAKADDGVYGDQVTADDETVVAQLDTAFANGTKRKFT